MDRLDGKDEDEAFAESYDEEEEGEDESDEMDHEESGLHEEAAHQPFEMSPNHSKILILISKYGMPATEENPRESWIRELPLTIMIYEGITQGVIDCDYAPKSLIISTDGTFKNKNVMNLLTDFSHEPERV